MNVYRQYNEDPSEEWKKITLTEALEDLEGSGYWKKGTSEAMLKEGHTLWTPFARYKMRDKALKGYGLQGLQTELRLEVKRQLDKCSPSATPNVCRKITTQDGYLKIESQVIRMMLHERISAGAAIAQIEMELA